MRLFAAATIAGLALVATAAARLSDDVPKNVFAPVKTTLPKAEVGQDPPYRVDFTDTFKGQPFPRGVFGCDTTTLGRPDLPTFNDCAKLPPGLALTGTVGCSNDTNGCVPLTGVPTKVGTYSFRMAASDGQGELIVRTYTLVVERAAGPQVSPTPGTLAAGEEGKPYLQHFTVSHGTPPYTVTSVAKDTPGLSFDPKTLTLSGTPTHPRNGKYHLKFIVRDAEGQTVKASYSFEVKGLEGGQLAVTARGDQTETSGGKAPLVFEVTIANLGTEATAATTVEITLRSADTKLFMTSPGAGCGRVSGSGTRAVHVSCPVGALKAGKDETIIWRGETEPIESTGSLSFRHVKVTAHAGRGSDRDEPGDNADSETVQISVR